MTVASILRSQVDIAESDLSIQAAAQRMAARNVGCLVVVDAQERPIGILTDRDITVRVVGSGRGVAETKVEEAMSISPRQVRPSTPLSEAVEIMRAASVRRLVVVDEEERLLGVITLDDVIQAMARTLENVRVVLERTSPRVLAES